MTLVSCPKCGHVFEPGLPPPVRRARMVWSNRLQRFVRMVLDESEYQRYERVGSID